MRCGCASAAADACACFLEHRTADLAVPLNEYTKVTTWGAAVTCGARPASDLATTILVCNWRLNISDYSDGSTPPFPNVRFGYGVFATENDRWIAGSHGFIDWDTGAEQPWQSGVAGLPAGLEWPDAVTSGSFAVPVNVAHSGPSTTFDIAAVLGIYNPGLAIAAFHIETYEYSLCGCACQE